MTKFRRLARTVLAAVVTFLGIASTNPAAAIDCAKAGSPVEKRICTDPGLKAADGSMARAYAALLKRAPDAKIRAMLVKSQRRWLAARDSGLGTDFEGNLLSVGELRTAIDARTEMLRDDSSRGLIATAIAQRRYFARFPAGRFSGFDTSCDFIPAERDDRPVLFLFRQRPCPERFAAL